MTDKRQRQEIAELETRLREAEDRFSVFSAATREAVIVHEQGFILDGNAALCEMFGYERDEVIGMRVDQLAAPASREEVIHSALTGRPEPYEALGQRKDGSRFFGRVHGLNTTLRGKVIRVTVVQDIDEQRKAEKERARFELRIQQAQKMESLGVLAGGIAHDFNNLLVGMLGNAGLALTQLPPESSVRRYLEQVEKAAQRAADLTNQLLAYSGKGRFVVEPLDVSTLVREMAHLLDTVISKSATLRLDLAEDLPAAVVDAAQIRQVVMNLLTNASDALGADGGAIHVQTGAQEVDAGYLGDTFLGDTLDAGRYVFIEVSDTGCGMDDEMRRQIFDPFFTTKFTGRGLGLAAVLGIVRGHRGTIHVYSEPGRGTTIKVLLPASTEARRVVRAAPAAKGELWRGHGTILVVDDEEIVRDAAKVMLEGCGFTVLTADGGVEAVETFRERHDSIRLVLLDMTMPRMTGDQTFTELRRIEPRLRVVLSSGYNEQDATNRFTGRGLAGFIQKPYTLAKLLEIVRAALAD